MEDMSAKVILSSLAGSLVASYAVYDVISHRMIFGGSVPRTVADKGWWEETDKKFQAWPREAGPPVIMNPISRQNFIVKASSSES